MSGRGVTDQDLKGLVYFARRLREETHGCGEWQEPGIVAAIEEMRNWNLEVALEQILRRATDPDARTPKAMLHRMASAALPSEKPKYAGPVKPADECPLHIGQPKPPYCPSCATDPVDAYSDHDTPDLPTWQPRDPEKAARLRALAGEEA